MKNFTYLKAFNSPFIRPKLRLYVGKLRHGTPYFYPRNWVKFTYKDCLRKATEETSNINHIYYGFNPLDITDKYKGYSKAVPKKIGFDFVNLGWKTKWKHDDFRWEWGPLWSFVFFRWQICIFFYVPEPSHYWASWLYYELETDKTRSQKERIEQCKKGFPQEWMSYTPGKEKELIDYYTFILKSHYL